jgi:hypothetical protein
VTATCTDVGKTSFDDCDALTWSLGCTGEPSAVVASEASTSLMFMFEEVPLPVWYVSTGNWSWWSPAMSWSAAPTIASAIAWSMMPSEPLTTAAARLMRARATICAGSRPDPEIGKFSTARWVWAP